MKGQSIAGIIPPSPQAYAMTSFEAQQPSLYTGTANVSIPLYAINFEGMQIPISLSYSAGGIKVSQEATEVGLGWSLNATAVISRSIEGIDDFYNTNFAKGYVHDTDSIQEVVFLSAYFNKLMTGLADTEPDIFSYNFFGYSGKFTLKKKSQTSDPIEVIKMTLDDTRIEYDENEEAFIVTTPMGFIGLFSVKERTTSVSAQAGVTYESWKNTGSYNDLTGLQNRGQYRAITSWYLKSITAPNGKAMNFDYDLPQDERSEYISITQPTFGNVKYTTTYSTIEAPTVAIGKSSTYFDENGTRVTNFWDALYTGGSYVFGSPSIEQAVYRTIQEHIYLTKVEIPNEIKVDFNMEDRYDLEPNFILSIGDSTNLNYIRESGIFLKRYSNIQITGLDSSTLSRSIVLDQSYFHNEFLYDITNGDNKFQWMRSRLDKVTVGDQVYRFEYNYGENGLPNKSNMGIDNYGYYFKDIQNDMSQVNLRYGFTVHGEGTYSSTPDQVTHYQTNQAKSVFDLSVIGTLSKVYYPTGGYSQFDYELKDYFVEGVNIKNGAEAINQAGASGNVKGGGLRVKGVTSYTSDGNVATKKTYKYVLDDNQNSSSGLLITPLWYFFYYLDDPNNDNIYYVQRVEANEVLALNSAQGSNIGYSRVVEIFEGDGDSFENVYTFENNQTALNPDVVNGLDLQVTDYKNGQLLEKSVKNSLLQEVEKNTTLYKNAVPEQIDGIKMHFNPSPNPLGGYAASWHYYTLPRAFTGVSQSTSTRKYSGSEISNTTIYNYNTNYQLSSEQTSGSNGEILKTTYRRPYDFTVNPIEAINEMVNRNIVAPVIEVISERNFVVVAAQGNKFELDQGNIVLAETYFYDRSLGTLPLTASDGTFSSPYVKENVFKFNDFGKLIESVDKAGVPTSIIWGHNNSLPIVKGEAISYDDLLEAHDDALKGDYESEIRTHPNTMNAMITTYSHDPFVGMKHQKDPNIIGSAYEYDANQRLENIFVNDTSITNHFQYNFSEGEFTTLVVGSTLDFGTVALSDTEEGVIKIKNTGNTVINIGSIQLPSNFYVAQSSFSIAPGDTYDLTIVFSAPSVEAPISDFAYIYEQGNPQAKASFILLADVKEPIRDLTLITGCAQIDYSFSQVNVLIQNNGNDYLEVTRVEIDEDEFAPEGDNDGLKLNFNSTYEYRPGVAGILYELPMYIAPNATGVFRVQYVGNNGGGVDLNNWDGQTKLYIFSNATNGYDGIDATVLVKRNCGN